MNGYLDRLIQRALSSATAVLEPVRRETTAPAQEPFATAPPLAPPPHAVAGPAVEFVEAPGPMTPTAAVQRPAAPIERQETPPGTFPVPPPPAVVRAVERADPPQHAAPDRVEVVQQPTPHAASARKPVPAVQPAPSAEFRPERIAPLVPPLQPFGPDDAEAHSLEIADRFMERITGRAPLEVNEAPMPVQVKQAPHLTDSPVAPGPPQAPAAVPRRIQAEHLADLAPRPVPSRPEAPRPAKREVVIGRIQVHVDAPSPPAPLTQARETVHRVIHAGGSTSPGPALGRSSRFGLGQI